VGAGPSAETVDWLTDLEKWVEKGVAPDRLIASHLTGDKVDRTRPVCPYPKLAVWNGTGSSDEAANFVC
jgi:feruloyl esterase